MQKTSLLLIALLPLLAVILSVSACVFWDCANSESFSPEELLQKNEYVFLGSYIAMDTLVYLGSLEYLWSDAQFFVMEYHFSPQRKIKFGERESSEIYLWNCEYVAKKRGYKSIPELKTDEPLLVYGNKIMQSQDIIRVMTPMTFIDDLEGLFQGKEPLHMRWNSIKEDSLLALRIKENNRLKLLLEQRNTIGQVIYATDDHCFTFNRFRDGEICYYDSSGWAHRTNREGYLKKLTLLTSVKF